MATATETEKTVDTALVEELFTAGAHLGYSKTRRHPSMKSYIFCTKSQGDMLDLEQTAQQIEAAKSFIKTLRDSGRVILFVATKPEGREITRSAAKSMGMPYIDERWIGGTLTNFEQIKKRIDHLQDLLTKEEAGTLTFATKKEHLMIEREIKKLQRKFGGLLGLEKKPDALFVIDTKKEAIAVAEANQMNVPVVGVCNSDCDVSKIEFPLCANDASTSSINFLVSQVRTAVN